MNNIEITGKAPIIDRVTLWVIFGLLIFNYGFQMLRIPPSGIGLPLSEILLAAVLFKANISVLLKKLKTVFNIYIFILFVVYGLLRIIIGFFDHGIMAIRDGLPIVESMYVLVGFHLAGNVKTESKISKYFVFTSLFIGLYILIYPLSASLQELSPKLFSSQGEPIAIFFNYINTGLVGLMVAAWSMERHMATNESKFIVYALFLAISILVLFPSRTLFLMLIAFAFLIYTRVKASSLVRLSPFLFGGMILFVVLINSGVNIQGRFGDSLSLDSYGRLFVEILFESDQGNISSGMGGRVIWWESIIDRVTESFVTILFGLGYGQTLIDFQGHGGVVVREPHNTLVSVFGRGGILGLGLFILFQFQILKVAYLSNKSLKKTKDNNYMILPIVMLLLGTLINTLGESPFIMPFYAVPYYFFAGCLMRYYYNVRISRGVCGY